MHGKYRLDRSILRLGYEVGVGNDIHLSTIHEQKIFCNGCKPAYVLAIWLLMLNYFYELQVNGQCILTM